uniref:Uncharacterized protein n=1 Tax=Physcomitrium patens TaxID=3218 RepID=A0A2K1J7W4_PHYPA|nr:hypothetical protein PHYPA_020739 [Physcomitrium patens]
MTSVAPVQALPTPMAPVTLRIPPFFHVLMLLPVSQNLSGVPQAFRCNSDAAVFFWMHQHPSFFISAASYSIAFQHREELVE